MSKEVFPNQRLIFLVLRYDGWQIGPMPVAGHATLLEALAQRIEWAAGISKAIGQEQKSPPIPNSYGYYFYDWELERLEPSMQVRELPKPGVLFAFPIGHGLRISQQARDGSEPYDEQKESWLLAHILKSGFPVGGEAADTVRQIHESLEEYIEKSPHATYEPSKYDVFFSYSSQDTEVAEELYDLMETEGLKCFMAGKDLRLGKFWEPEILRALKSAKVCVVLLTPQSIESRWVMCEGGGFWALENPIVPALLQVGVESLPEPIKKHQGMKIDTIKSRNQFCSKVKELAGIIRATPAQP